MTLFVLIVSVLFFSSTECIQFHTMQPNLSAGTAQPSASCVKAIHFNTMITGLPPDIESERYQNGESKIKITPSKENGQQSMSLNILVKEVLNEEGIISSSDQAGIDVKEGIFMQINNHLAYSGWGYGSLLISTMTGTIIPGHANIVETFDITVFENQKLMLRKRFTHSVSQWQWILLAPFFWAGEDFATGQRLFREVIRETVRDIASRKEDRNGRCITASL